MTTKTEVTAKTEAKNVAAKANDVKDAIVERAATVRGIVGPVASATGTASKSYVTGMFSLGKALIGFGREATEDTFSHVKALTKATCLRNAAEMHADFLQNRIENSAGHVKEFADLTREKAEETIQPFVALLDERKSA